MVAARHDTPSDDEGDSKKPPAPPRRGAEIVGMDDEQELNPSDDIAHHAGKRETELRKALLRRLDEPEVKAEPRSRSPKDRRRRSRSGSPRRRRSRSGDRKRGHDGERRRRGSRSPERRRGDSRERDRGRDRDRPTEQPGHPPRPGDWTCPSCKANVFASKSECFRCREPKPAGLPEAPGGTRPPKDGEWTCNHCGANVYASKIECFRCNAAKGSKGTGDVKTEPGTGGGGRGGGGRAKCKFDPDEPLLPALAARKDEDWASLPVFEYRTTIMDMIRTNRVTVLTGETGSGKTTQIPQYIAAEKGWTGRIAVTQPRRVAAVSVARRVAEEVGCECGDEIGYAIRFEDITSDKTRVKYLTDGILLRELKNWTRVKYLTDGILLRELLTDRLLSDYSVVMLDEAHERSLHTDILFALMKEVVTARPDDFRLLVTSATLDVSKFSHYFFDAPTIDVPGRCFPVEIQHVDSNRYVDKAMELVDVLHSTEPTEHHILVFLTGEDEIVRCCQGVNQKIKRRQDDGEAVQGLRICMLHSSLPVEFYQRVFDEPPDGTRKLVVATNIAETSITVPGIKFVIDCGAVKQKIFNAESGMESLNIVPVSKQAAKQRAGRAGRTGPGICLRLYSQKRMDTEFPDETAPEILRTNLASTVLTLKGMGINDPLSFDYMDAPDTEKLVAALRMLYLLGALDADGHLSKLGRDMALFPLEPALSRMILASIHHDCADDMVTVVAMLAADGANVFYRPTMAEEKEMATAAKQRFYDPEGDYAGLLKLFNEWVAAGGVRGGLKWSKDNYVHSRAMCRAWDVRQQLLGIMGRFDMPITKAKRVQQVGRAIAESLYVNAARRGGKDCYETLAEGRMVAVSPSSLLAPFDKDDWAELVVCLEMVWTSNGQMRFVCAAKAKWVMDLLPKINTVDIKRLCGGNMKIKKKGADVGLADVRAAEAAKVEVKKDTGEVNDAKARYLERKKAREAAAK